MITRSVQNLLKVHCAFFAFNSAMNYPSGPRSARPVGNLYSVGNRYLVGCSGAAHTHAIRVAHSPHAVLNLVDQRVQAYKWMSGLGTPAALIAGGALTCFFETGQDLAIQKGEKYWVSVMKQLAKLLFLTAFALNIACMYVTTVTGTMLLGKGVPNPLAGSACFMLNRELEFEYLFSRIAFFQGLLHWLIGVALHQLRPMPNASKASIYQQFSASAGIITSVIYMVSFYNKHISYYKDYSEMLRRLVFLWFERYYHLDARFRILPMMALIPLLLCVSYGLLSISEFDH